MPSARRVYHTRTPGFDRARPVEFQNKQMSETASALQSEKPEVEDLPEPRICLRHKVSRDSNTNCPLCRAYAKARNDVEKARKLYVKRPIEVFAEKPNLEVEPVYKELPLFDESFYEKIVAETFGVNDEEYVN